jgi:hypothetical protein
MSWCANPQYRVAGRSQDDLGQSRKCHVPGLPRVGRLKTMTTGRRLAENADNNVAPGSREKRRSEYDEEITLHPITTA